jgi:hypothetical protein
MDTDVPTESAPAPSGEGDRASGDVAPPHVSRGRRRLVWVLLGVAVVAVAVGSVWFARRWSERGADEASMSEARARAQGPEVAEGLLQPASGVYTYASAGTESLSLLGTTQSWGATIPATVTAAEGSCWVLRLDYSTHHWNAQTYCPSGTVLEETTSVGYQAFDFVATTIGEETNWVCDPPGEAIRHERHSGNFGYQRRHERARRGGELAHRGRAGAGAALPHRARPHR